MNFAGLSIGQMAAWFAALSLAFAALYLLKLRRRSVQVPFLPLWSQLLRDSKSTAWLSRLRRLLSLLLQLLLLLLLILALGDPRSEGALFDGRTVVVLLDASASMQSTDVEGTRFARAKQEAERLIGGMGGADRMLLALMGPTTVALGPMSSDQAELTQALAQAQVSDAPADLSAALRFADDVLLGEERAEIVLLTDGALGDALQLADERARGELRAPKPRAKISVLPIGERGDNLAITQFSVRRYVLDKSRYEVMIELRNSGREEAELELQLLADGELTELLSLKLPAGESLSRFYPNLTGAQQKLQAKIVPKDPARDVLPLDNHAYAVLPERKRAKVLLVTPGNTYLEAALLLDEYLELQAITPQEYLSARSQAHDVVIFDGVTPLQSPDAHVFYINPSGPGSPVEVGAVWSSPGFDQVDRKHPLMRHLALEDVNIAQGRKLLPKPGDRVLGGAAEGALLIAGERANKRFLALGFDPRESDLPLRLSWPLLMIAAIDHFVDEPEEYTSPLRTGEIWRVPVGAAPERLQLTAPDGSVREVSVHQQRAVWRGEQQGFYQLQVPEQPSVWLAANLASASESEVAPHAELQLQNEPLARVAESQLSLTPRREIWGTLVLLVLLLAAFEWASYHRRITV